MVNRLPVAPFLLSLYITEFLLSNYSRSTNFDNFTFNLLYELKCRKAQLTYYSSIRFATTANLPRPSPT